MTITNFTPITFMPCYYKIIIKLIANRIKGILPHYLILTRLALFLADNIIIAKEVVQSMRTKKGNKSLLAIKVDMEKAYDKIS